MKKTYEEYHKEYQVLINMLRCSKRYLYGIERTDLGEGQKEIDREIHTDINTFYVKYRNKLEKKCLKMTGKSLIQHNDNQ